MWRSDTGTMIPYRPSWIEVDLGVIARNVRLIRELLPPGTALLAVVKANGYGHGAIPVARTALDAGAALLGVTCLDEALELRHAGITAGILMLGYAPPEHADLVVEYGIIANCYSPDVLEALDRAAARAGAVARVHLKVDTGMGRLGPLPAEFPSLVDRSLGLRHVRVEGIFSHLASADNPDSDQTARQGAEFERLVAAAARRGLTPRYVHLANSAATFTGAAAVGNLVRIGAALYGLHPSARVPCPPGIQPALTFKTRVSQVKDLPAGSAVSYGATYVTPRDARIAVLQAGYADGLRRGPQSWGEVLVRGRRAPIVGAVCMDMCMVDVTHVPDVRAGDEVVLVGRQGGDCITLEEVARCCGTGNYEVACQLASRLPRMYVPDVAAARGGLPRPFAGVSRDGSSVEPAVRGASGVAGHGVPAR